MPLLAVGGFRKVEEKATHPVLYHFCGSFNSGKASLAAQLCSKADDFELKFTLHMRDNYTLEYARLNPDTMAVPTLRMDNFVFTDSYDMIKYLRETYPGAGDQEVAQNLTLQQQMLTFIELVRNWDEYMFTYGHQGQAMSDTANGIRLANLRLSLEQVLNERPEDCAFLTDKFINKIAGVTVMKRAQLEGAEKERRLAENITQLHGVLEEAERILKINQQIFLFVDTPTTGDVYLLSVFRIFHVAVPKFWLDSKSKYPLLDRYWEQAKTNHDVDVGLMKFVKPHVMGCAMLSAGVPGLLLRWKLGCLKTPALPDDVEKRIEAKTAELWAKS